MKTRVQRPALSRVRLQHFRSIEKCDVKLGQLMFLVGRNGAGKSNFVDALRFVAQSLDVTLDYALERRGGIVEVRQRSKTKPYDLSIELWLNLPKGAEANYSFTVGSTGNDFRLKAEQCAVWQNGKKKASFQVSGGQVSGLSRAPQASADRLYLVRMSGEPHFRPVFDLLKGMAFYNLAPNRMREAGPVDGRHLLLEDGGNIGAAIEHLQKSRPKELRRVNDYLKQVLPGLESLERYLVDTRESVEFIQNGWRFQAQQMSDGTLRALGILTAVLGARPNSLVGIEEPEIALHPAAFGVLRDCLREGAEHTQILVTSQSPDLLDDHFDPGQFLAVNVHNGLTRIGPLNEVGAEMMRDQLCTAGDLLRQGQAEPEGALA